MSGADFRSRINKKQSLRPIMFRKQALRVMRLALCLSPFSVLRCSRRFLAYTSGSTAESTTIPSLRRPSIAFYACSAGILPTGSSSYRSPFSASLNLIMKAVLFLADCHIHIQLNRSELHSPRYLAQHDESVLSHWRQGCAKAAPLSFSHCTV